MRTKLLVFAISAAVFGLLPLAASADNATSTPGASTTTQNTLLFSQLTGQSTSTPATTTPLTLNPATSTTQSLTVPTGLQFTDIPQMQDNRYGLQASSQYPNGPRLIKLEGTSKVYWVNGNNFKMLVPNSKIMKSYGSKDADVATVSQQEFDYYENTDFIKLKGSSKIYKVTSNVKRFIPQSVWDEAGVEAGQVIEVNKSEFNFYRTGKNYKNVDELFPQDQ